jgi:stage III sporulation protein SpoIIIAA
MTQALANHNPDVIVVDEIGSSAEVEAVRSICQRGVVMVGTAHATSLHALMQNPVLNPLLGSTHEVILSEREKEVDARRGVSAGGKPARTGKTRQERRTTPAFQMVVELLSPTQWRIHLDAAASVDAVLDGRVPETQLRTLRNGQLYTRFEGL